MGYGFAATGIFLSGVMSYLAVKWLCVVALACGCAAKIPGDGRLVAVRLSPAVATYMISPDDDATGGKFQPVPLASFAADGVRYWDVVGAQLRVGIEESQAASVLEIVPDDGGVGSPPGDVEGWWSPVDGKIHVVLPLRFAGPPSSYRTFFAHEAGHALGLDHVDDNDEAGYFTPNVMDPLDLCDGLGELDRAAFAKRAR